MELANPFQKLFNRRVFSPREKVTFRFLKRCQLFEALTDEELSEFLPYLHYRKFKNGEAIFFRGDPSQALYIIQSGEVVLNLDVQDKFEELITLTKGDLFGDNAMLENGRRYFNAIASSENCELIVIPQVNIMAVFDDNIQIRSKMLNSFARYYDNYINNIFKSYRQSFGFFDLGAAYLMTKRKST
jgi:CRP-like cAMP-binding protein